MQARLILGKNEIGFKADDVREEPAELINLALDNDVRSRVLRQIILMLLDLLFEGFGLLGEAFDLVAQPEHFEELLLL